MSRLIRPEQEYRHVQMGFINRSKKAIFIPFSLNTLSVVTGSSAR
jgi:hypothetical protein